MEFLVFFPSEDFLVFLSVFPFFSKDFRGSVGKKILVFSMVFLAIFQKNNPEGPRIEKIQSREAILKKSSLQYGMKFSIENEIFIPGPSLAAEKQGLGLKFSIENEIFKPRMKISSENENFVRGGMVFSCVRARMNFFDPRALWEGKEGQGKDPP